MITEADFIEMTGFRPEDDDLERANCNQTGEPGHYFCGICPDCNKPRLICGHPYVKEEDK